MRRAGQTLSSVVRAISCAPTYYACLARLLVIKTPRTGATADHGFIISILTGDSGADSNSDSSSGAALPAGFLYDFHIDWGDGSAGHEVRSASGDDIFGLGTFSFDNSITHGIAGGEEVLIVLSGTVPALRMPPADSQSDSEVVEKTTWSDSDLMKTKAFRDALVRVENLGDTDATHLEGAFRGCKRLTRVTGGSVAGVVTMREMFYGAAKLTELDTTGWDVRQVGDFTAMFGFCC